MGIKISEMSGIQMVKESLVREYFANFGEAGYRLEFRSRGVIIPDSARYSAPNISRIPSFFRIAKRGRVIC